MPTSTNSGLWRVGGMHGSAWRDGKQLAELVEVTATVEINRIEVPLVGAGQQGYKPGRESREGTIRVQKVDSSWEMEVYSFLSQGVAERRRLRGTDEAGLRPFQLSLEFDDPDALGYELWQLEGCLIWRMPLGFSITDDIIDREFPLTWESERPLAHFERTGELAPSGLPAVNQTGTYNKGGLEDRED
jgi:Phage tail tube protein